MRWLERISRVASDYFAVFVMVVSVVAMMRPHTFAFALPHISTLLGVIMFGMGMTLTGADFRRVLSRPRAVAIGAAAQYGVMPIVGYVVARILRLPPELAVGVILVGTCPGGTASNVITFLAKGDVPLSVTMTSVSTLLSPLLTPMLTLWLAGRWMPLKAGDLFLSIVQVVLVPVVLGVLVNRFFSKTVERSVRVLPLISVTAIVLIVGAIIGANADRLATVGPRVAAAVVLHNGLGLLLGWLLARVFRMDVPQRRAVTIEVGMQNSGLAVAMATAHVSALAAVPGAIFSVWHNVSGALLANLWTRLDARRARLAAAPRID